MGLFDGSLLNIFATSLGRWFVDIVLRESRPHHFRPAKPLFLNNKTVVRQNGADMMGRCTLFGQEWVGYFGSTPEAFPQVVVTQQLFRSWHEGC